MPTLFKKHRRIFSLVLFLIISSTIVTILVLKSKNTAENNLPISKTSSENKNGQQSHFGQLSSLPSCGSKKDFYSTSPLKVSDISNIAPLGNVNPSGHVFPTDHVYFFIRKPSTSGDQHNIAPVEVPLYSPGNVTITSVRISEHLSDGYTDYDLSFSPCRELVGRFGHITSLVAKIKNKISTAKVENEYETGGKKFRLSSAAVQIKINAEEQIGTAGGRLGQNALDMWTSDYRQTPLVFANQDRWTQRDSVYIACPIDYFTSSTKPTLENLLGSETKKRTVSPICGTIAQDIAGTAQGNWILAGTKELNNEDPHLALIHNNYDPAIPNFSIGTSLAKSGLNAGIYTFAPSSSASKVNQDFGKVVDNQTYCYEINQIYDNSHTSTVLIQLTSSTTLRVEGRAGSSCGSGPWAFDNNYTDFER